jgi:hypothetical protein
MPQTPIANGAEALIVSAREARTYYRSGVIPGGGQRVTVLCHVPANADLADVAQTAGVLGKPDAQDAAPLKGLARVSLRERYMVRIERVGRKGAALAPSYKTPLAGTLIPAPPVKAKAPAKASKATAARGASFVQATAQALSQVQQAAQQSAAPITAAANVAQGSAVANKRGKGA